MVRKYLKWEDLMFKKKVSFSRMLKVYLLSKYQIIPLKSNYNRKFKTTTSFIYSNPILGNRIGSVNILEFRLQQPTRYLGSTRRCLIFQITFHMYKI